MQRRQMILGLTAAIGASVAGAVAYGLPPNGPSRPADSRNHIKIIALAMHNYHDLYRSFPQGAHSNDALKPEQRLSWLADLLPLLEQNSLHRKIDFTKAWNDEANKAAMKQPIEIFLNPAASERTKGGYPVSHYVGLAGLGADGPTLPVNSPKAGVFAYNRFTRIREITDGTSNTAMISEASKDFGPWGAGGAPTIRPLTKKPYFNGPDGIGGPSPDGCHLGMVDGSVRFVSKDIDPKVMEAVMTIRGGERIDVNDVR